MHYYVIGWLVCTDISPNPGFLLPNSACTRPLIPTMLGHFKGSWRLPMPNFLHNRGIRRSETDERRPKIWIMLTWQVSCPSFEPPVCLMLTSCH